MPRNSPTGFVCAFFATFVGFALIWHIWWLAALACVGAFATFVVFAWRDRTEYRIPAEEVARIDRANRAARRLALAQDGAGRMSIAARTTGFGDSAREEVARARRPSRPRAAPSWPPKRIIVGYGFWIFLLSDIVMFSAFFATYAVLVDETAGGPSGKDLFDLDIVAVETACLLLSSFTCGIASIGARARNGSMYYGGMAVTACSARAFLVLEVHEFAGMIARAPARSAAPSCRPSSRWSAATGCTSRSACCGCSR